MFPHTHSLSDHADDDDGDDDDDDDSDGDSNSDGDADGNDEGKNDDLLIFGDGDNKIPRTHCLYLQHHHCHKGKDTSSTSNLWGALKIYNIGWELASFSLTFLNFSLLFLSKENEISPISAMHILGLTC